MDNTKTKKKRGCLYAFLIGLAVFGVLIIILIFTVKDLLQIYGLSSKVYAEYVDLLNREVNELELAPQKINSGDYVSFKTKADSVGFDIFDANGNVDIERTTITLNESFVLTNYELAAMLNNSFTVNAKYKMFSLLQLDITVAKHTTVKSVMKLDITELKSEIGNFGKDLPNKLYFTCESVATTSGNRLILTSSTIKINQLEEKKNEGLVQLLKAMTSNAEMGINFENINNEIISDIITKVARASRVNLETGANSLSFLKID